MLVLRTSNFHGVTIRPIIVLRHKHAIFFCALVQKSIRLQLNYFQLFETKAVKALMKNLNRKTPFIQFQLFIFHKPACLEINFLR